MADKKFRIVYPTSPTVDEFPSENSTYDFVAHLRDAWADGEIGAAGTMTVQVDEGTGWQPYEQIDFAKEH